MSSGILQRPLESVISRSVSAKGQKRTVFTAPIYDCLPPKANILQHGFHVCYVPEADI